MDELQLTAEQERYLEYYLKLFIIKPFDDIQLRRGVAVPDGNTLEEYGTYSIAVRRMLREGVYKYSDRPSLNKKIMPFVKYNIQWLEREGIKT